MNLRSDQHFFYAIQIQYDKIYISNCECENYEYDVMWENVDRRRMKIPYSESSRGKQTQIHRLHHIITNHIISTLFSGENH